MTIDKTAPRRGSLARIVGAFGLTFLFFGCIHVAATTAMDQELHRTMIDGYPLYTEVYGEADLPVVIAVHGGPGGDLQYLKPLTALSDRYRVVLYDQRGTGLSAREDVSSSFQKFLDRQIADLDGLVEQFGQGKKVRMIGHSWGGMLVSAYLSRYPMKVSHAVIVEPGILRPDVAPHFVQKMKDSQSIWDVFSIVPPLFKMMFVSSEDGHERKDYLMTSMMGHAEGPPYQCPGERLPEASFRRAGYAVFSATILPMMDDPAVFNVDLTEGLHQYRGKLMLLSSECSFIGYDYQEKYHRPFFPPQTMHKKLEHTGHNMFTIRPDPAIHEVRQFFRQ